MAAHPVSAASVEDPFASGPADTDDDGEPLSAFLSKAIEDRIAILGLRRLVADYEAEHGAFTAEELATADALLDAAGVGDRRARRRVGHGA